MSFTKSEYIEWRENSVTEQFMAEVRETIDTLIASLVTFAGENSTYDAKRSGEIKGLNQLFDWEPVVENEREDNQTDET